MFRIFAWSWTFLTFHFLEEGVILKAGVHVSEHLTSICTKTKTSHRIFKYCWGVSPSSGVVVLPNIELIPKNWKFHKKLRVSRALLFLGGPVAIRPAAASPLASTAMLSSFGSATASSSPPSLWPRADPDGWGCLARFYPKGVRGHTERGVCDQTPGSRGNPPPPRGGEGGGAPTHPPNGGITDPQKCPAPPSRLRTGFSHHPPPNRQSERFSGKHAWGKKTLSD